MHHTHPHTHTRQCGHIQHRCRRIHSCLELSGFTRRTKTPENKDAMKFHFSGRMSLANELLPKGLPSPPRHTD